MSPTSVADLAGRHPVVSILFARGDEPGSYDSTSLQEFVDYELTNAKNVIPYNMTDFYTDYLNFSIISYLSKNRGQYGPRHFRFNIRNILDRLAKLAYLSAVRKVKITEAMVLKVLPSLDISDEEDKKTIDSDGNEEQFPVPSLEFRTFGILERDVDVSKKPHVRVP